MAANALTSSLTLTGLHHLTAVTGTAGRNLEFYSQVLGLRLVKKTVNQDDLSAYHLFYGDEMGHPGTEVTFFDWPAARISTPGHGHHLHHCASRPRARGIRMVAAAAYGA